jgi:peptidoglycan/LPS O-acetylase OafA/YrhL
MINRTDFTFKQLKNFWIRRWLRTLPAYFCVLSLMIALDIHLYDRGVGYYIRYMFFLQNVSYGPPVVYPESWSLTIEEWFYILLPLASFLLVKLTNFNRKHLMLWVICFVLLSVTVVRCYKVYKLTISSYDDWNYFVNKSLFLRMDSIMYGVLGAWLHYYRHPVWKYRNFLFFSGVFLLFYPYLHDWIFGFDAFTLYSQLTIKGLSALFLLPKMSTINSGRGKFYRLITLTSITSYSIYLVNFYPFNQFGLTFLKRMGIPEQHTILLDMVRLLAFLCWTAIISFGLYKFVEEPFMKLRSRVSKPENSSKVHVASPSEMIL